MTVLKVRFAICLLSDLRNGNSGSIESTPELSETEPEDSSPISLRRKWLSLSEETRDDIKTTIISFAFALMVRVVRKSPSSYPINISSIHHHAIYSLCSSPAIFLPFLCFQHSILATSCSWTRSPKSCDHIKGETWSSSIPQVEDTLHPHIPL